MQIIFGNITLELQREIWICVYGTAMPRRDGMGWFSAWELLLGLNRGLFFLGVSLESNSSNRMGFSLDLICSLNIESLITLP